MSLHKGKRLPRDNPTSYRGIAIMDQIAKLYAGVAYKSVETKANKLQLRARGQAGFRAGCRIEDHIITLKQIEQVSTKLS